MRLDLIVPVLMGVAVLWWIGRGLRGGTRLAVAAITLAIVVAIVLAERALQ